MAYADPTAYRPRKPKFKPIHVPQRSELSFWTSKTDPKKIYRDNGDHWSKQRIGGYTNLAYKGSRFKDDGILPRKDIPPQYQWIPPKHSFDSVCVEALAGEKPGFLSQGKSKGLRKEWTEGYHYMHASLDFHYWLYDERSPFQSKREKKMITSVTAHPAHNMKVVSFMNPRMHSGNTVR